MISRLTLPCLGAALLGAALAGAPVAGAQAQVIYGQGAYGQTSYGYAGPAIRGDYVGAPLTRFPRPDQIVPSAWGYGTYGVPTVAGLPPAPVGTPTVYVIETPAPVARPRVTTGPRILARTRTGRFAPAAPTVTAGGARVVSVSVPPRHAGLR